MLIDILVLIAIMWWTWRGYGTGAFQQIVKLATLVAGYVGSRLLGPSLAPIVGQIFKVARPMDEIASSMLLWLFFSFLIGAVLKYMLKALVEQKLATGNRVAGAFLGCIKSGVVAYLVLCLLAVMAEPISAWIPEKVFPISDSGLVQLAGRHNVVVGWAAPALDRLKELANMSHMRRSELSDDTQNLLRDPRVGPLVRDSELAPAIKQGDWGKVLKDPRIKNIFSDPNLMKQIMESNVAARTDLMQRIN